MNDVKFPRHKIADYFQQHYPQANEITQMLEMYPGDQFINGSPTFRSKYHEKYRNTELSTLVSEVYQSEINSKKSIEPISKEDFSILFSSIKKHVESNYHVVPENLRTHFIFGLQLYDYKEEHCIQIDLRPDHEKVKLFNNPTDEHKLVVKLKSKTLKYSINEEWGGDAIIIGYGCEIEVFEQESIRQELDNFAIHLLTKYPNTKAYIKKTPVRAAKYLLSDKIKRKFLWDKFIHKNKENPYMDPILKVDDIWLGRTNCDICKKCNLPLQTDEMVNKYYPAI